MKRNLTVENISDILVKHKLISPEQKKRILSIQAEQKEKLKKYYELKTDMAAGMPELEITPAEIISSLKILDKTGKGFITEDEIMQAVGKELGFEFKKIDPIDLDLDVVTKTVSKAFAIKHLAVPIEIKGGELRVAMVDPLNRDVLEDIKKVQKLKAIPVVSTKTDIIKLIREFYGFKQSVVMAEKELVTPLVDIGNLEQYSKLGTADDIATTDKYIKSAVDHLFRHAAEQRASDIHIEPKREKGLVRLRIDGVLHTIYSIPIVVHSAVVSRIKMLSRMDIAEKRRPQDGRIKIGAIGGDLEIRVSTVPVAFGEKVVMRILNQEILFQDIEKLGFLSTDLIHYRKFLEQPYGIILVTGPTGSGKTTTLYSSIKFLSSSEKNITTVEDPIEMVCEEFNQIAVQPSVGVTFGSVLRNILRQDPDIIMIGEIRDQETAQNAIQASLTGHLVLSTLHTNDSASAVTRLMDLGVEPFLLSSTLLGVVAQRLVRNVCPYCQEVFYIPKVDLQNLGVEFPANSADDQLQMKHGKGCSKCRFTGYVGREGVFEVLKVDEEIRELINSRTSAEIIKKTARKKGMKLLSENAAVKIVKGVTTYHEVMRCVSQQE